MEAVTTALQTGRAFRREAWAEDDALYFVGKFRKEMATVGDKDQNLVLDADDLLADDWHVRVLP
jgi:hypothetical protein